MALLFSRARYHHEQQQLHNVRRSNILGRRERLRQLFAAEKEQYEEELTCLPIRQRTSSQKPTIEELREAKERLRQERMRDQEAEAKEKMLQHWKLNNPDFREVSK